MEDTSFAVPVTPKQIAYARSLALKNQTLLPWEVQQDRRALSSWIDAQAKLKPVSALDQRIRPVEARLQAFSGCQFQGMSSSMRLIL